MKKSILVAVSVVALGSLAYQFRGRESITPHGGSSTTSGSSRAEASTSGEWAPGIAQTRGESKANELWKNLLASMSGRRSQLSEPFPSETTRLAPVFEYWSAGPVDPEVTTREEDRIQELLDAHEVAPSSMSISCSSKICRSQMVFTDIGAAVRLHQIKRRSDRRSYGGADPGDEGFRVSLYWTLTDEATAEAPDPTPEERAPGEPEVEPKSLTSGVLDRLQDG